MGHGTIAAAAPKPARAAQEKKSRQVPAMGPRELTEIFNLETPIYREPPSWGTGVLMVRSFGAS
jgi:hypothetical protein